jgi:hypothetical protein
MWAVFTSGIVCAGSFKPGNLAPFDNSSCHTYTLHLVKAGFTSKIVGGGSFE